MELVNYFRADRTPLGSHPDGLGCPEMTPFWIVVLVCDGSCLGLCRPNDARSELTGDPQSMTWVLHTEQSTQNGNEKEMKSKDEFLIP